MNTEEKNNSDVKIIFREVKGMVEVLLKYNKDSNKYEKFKELANAFKSYEINGEIFYYDTEKSELKSSNKLPEDTSNMILCGLSTSKKQRSEAEKFVKKVLDNKGELRFSMLSEKKSEKER